MQCRMMSLNHIGYERNKNDIANNKSHKSQPHQMNHHARVNNHQPHRIEQANHVEREVVNLMADKRIAQQQTKASDLQT